TLAPVNPWPLMRLFRIAIDCVICPLVGAGWPGVSTTVLIVTVVPLERSRPRPTLNLSCQFPGCTNAPPMIAANITISSATRTPRERHGREAAPCCLDDPRAGRCRDGLLLGGATCACP